MPILSVVIANYNYGRFIEDAIRSVLTQNCEDVELIVVDGGSTDNSVEVIQKYADRIAWWVSEKDNGQSDAFNKGFAHARGKYLTWLNADDVLVSGCLKKICAAFHRHPECEWFTANSFSFCGDGKVFDAKWGPHIYPAVLQRRNSPLVAFGPSTFFTKRLLVKVGGVDVSLNYVMDTDLWLKFMHDGVKQRRINCFCWAFRMHEDSKTAEFGDHRLDEVSHARLKAEEQLIMGRLNYRMSRTLYRLVHVWRILDGSLFVRAYLRMTFNRFACNMI